MSNLVLVGGPFDGSEGPCELEGEESLWIRVHDDPDRVPARNGLIVSASPRPNSFRYALLLSQDNSFIYCYGDSREWNACIERQQVYA